MSTSYFNDLQLLHGATGLHPAAPIDLQGRNYYCLQYNQSGTIEVKIDDEPVRRIVGPSLLVTSPGHRFCFGNYDGWHHNYIAFRGARVGKYIRSGLLPLETPLLRIRSGAEFREQFQSCVSALRAGDTLKASHQLEGLLVLLHAPSESLAPRPHHNELRRFAAEMRIAPERNHCFAESAKRMHVSEAHFRRLFRNLIGCAPGRFLLQCRLAAASDLLATTQMPIKQIAAAFHFESIHHFTRVFRQHYGVPPGCFRREMLGD